VDFILAHKINFWRKNMSKKLVRPSQLSAQLSVSITTLWRWRKQKIIPEPISLGARVIGWEQSTIDEWLAGLNKPLLENPKK
jgi:prophage regulatory protein